MILRFFYNIDLIDFNFSINYKLKHHSSISYNCFFPKIIHILKIDNEEII